MTEIPTRLSPAPKQHARCSREDNRQARLRLRLISRRQCRKRSAALKREELLHNATGTRNPVIAKASVGLRVAARRVSQ